MNYYDILGITPDSTMDDIKLAYRKKAMKFHPDRGGDANHFKDINQAYIELTSVIEQATSFEPEYNWDVDDDDFADLASEPIIQNENLAIKLNISLEQSYNDTMVETRYELLSGSFQTAELKIPAGIKTNQVIHYTGFGDDSIHDIPRGDLIVTFIVDQHDTFIRRADDLCMTLSISALEAMIGTTRVIQGLDGESYELTINAGTQPYEEVVFSSYGFLNIKKNKRGNFVVIVSITVPTITDKFMIRALRNIHKRLY